MITIELFVITTFVIAFTIAITVQVCKDTESNERTEKTIKYTLFPSAVCAYIVSLLLVFIVLMSAYIFGECNLTKVDNLQKVYVDVPSSNVLFIDSDNTTPRKVDKVEYMDSIEIPEVQKEEFISAGFIKVETKYVLNLPTDYKDRDNLVIYDSSLQ